ncbi:Cof-type HAD-IIB family hydrolase [Vaginisenegalia massiliensis]|uniref:Cof-type HAD-IIB family hydrolase n=1 Tax=Vaginisenegalia massiliensis TaxID=2058294 RepID=UPI000F53C73F|nr:Cof-type HAD-IIB family hydrolase [Vaginisenegalia massiliensis]
MTYKMLVVDIDDTLLNSNHEISALTYQRLQDLQAAGVYLVLASGRPTESMVETARHLRLDLYQSYIISYNGAVVTRMSDQKELFSQRLEIEDQKALIQAIQSRHLCLTTYVDGKILLDYPNQYSDVEAELTGLEANYSPQTIAELDKPCLKFMAVGDPSQVAEWNQELQGHFGKKVYATTSKPFFLEFMHQDVSKGEAISKLCHYLNMNLDAVIACGDGNNDASMIQVAGLGVAMANASDYLKSISDYITLSNDQDGLIKVIDEFILKD